MIDNGSAYKSRMFAAALKTHGIAHKQTRPYTPTQSGANLNRSRDHPHAMTQAIAVIAASSDRVSALIAWAWSGS